MSSRLTGRLVKQTGDFLYVIEYLFEEREASRYRYTKGLRYKIILLKKDLRDSKKKPQMLLRYDNYHESEPHIHVGQDEKVKHPYRFKGIEALLFDFQTDAFLQTGYSFDREINRIRRKIKSFPEFEKFW